MVFILHHTKINVKKMSLDVLLLLIIIDLSINNSDV